MPCKVSYFVFYKKACQSNCKLLTNFWKKLYEIKEPVVWPQTALGVENCLFDIEYYAFCKIFVKKNNTNLNKNVGFKYLKKYPLFYTIRPKSCSHNIFFNYHVFYTYIKISFLRYLILIRKIYNKLKTCLMFNINYLVKWICFKNKNYFYLFIKYISAVYFYTLRWCNWLQWNK